MIITKAEYVAPERLQVEYTTTELVGIKPGMTPEQIRALPTEETPRSSNWQYPNNDEKQAALEKFLADNGLTDFPQQADAPVGREDVNAERDRRIYSDITFKGTVFDGDRTSQDRLMRARAKAETAINKGKLPGDYRWHGMPVDFVWIAKDNSLVPMDAQTVISFSDAMITREGMLILKATQIKALLPADIDITNDAAWGV